MNRFVSSKKKGNKVPFGDEMTYLLVFGTNLATIINKSVFGNGVLDENFCFLFFLREPIGLRFESNRPNNFGVHRLRLRNYVWRASGNSPHSLTFHERSTATAKMDHLGRFRPSGLVPMIIVGWMQSVSQKKIKKIIDCGDEMTYPVVFGIILAISAPSLSLATPYSTNYWFFFFFFFLNPFQCILAAISHGLVFIGHN